MKMFQVIPMFQLKDIFFLYNFNPDNIDQQNLKLFSRINLKKITLVLIKIVNN